MLRYVKYQNKSTIQSVKDKWFLRVKHEETIDLEALAEHMSSHNSPYSEGLINGVLKDMTKCIEELLLDGKKVKIGDLGIFYLSVQCKGADKSDDATPSNIRGFKFNARGTGKTTGAALATKVHLKEQDEYSIA